MAAAAGSAAGTAGTGHTPVNLDDDAAMSVCSQGSEWSQRHCEDEFGRMHTDSEYEFTTYNQGNAEVTRQEALLATHTRGLERAKVMLRKAREARDSKRREIQERARLRRQRQAEIDRDNAEAAAAAAAKAPPPQAPQPHQVPRPHAAVLSPGPFAAGMPSGSGGPFIGAVHGSQAWLAPHATPGGTPFCPPQGAGYNPNMQAIKPPPPGVSFDLPQHAPAPTYAPRRSASPCLALCLCFRLTTELVEPDCLTSNSLIRDIPCIFQKSCLSDLQVSV